MESGKQEKWKVKISKTWNRKNKYIKLKIEKTKN